MLQHIDRHIRATLATATVLACACGRSSETPKTPLSEFSPHAAVAGSAASAADTADPLPRNARVALDRANALFRVKQYADALAQYRLAATRAPDDGAAYFGMYMVAGATKNASLMDSAVAALKARGLMAPVHKENDE